MGKTYSLASMTSLMITFDALQMQQEEAELQGMIKIVFFFIKKGGFKQIFNDVFIQAHCFFIVQLIFY